MSKSAKADDIQAMPYERAIQELEQIAGRLERGDVPLEESIAIYERGAALRAHCESLLKAAEARVEKLTFDNAGAPNGTTPLDVES